MAIQGLQSTANFGGTIGQPDTIPAFERPTNWRQGILMRFPNGHAPLVALTSVMKKKVTDDPQFQWWERELSDIRVKLGADATTVATTLTFVADPFGHGGVDQLKAGDLIRSEKETAGRYEIIKITSVNIGANTADVIRNYNAAFGGAQGTGQAYTAATAGDPEFHLVGSVYPEAADTPESIRYRPTKHYSYTQIFRDSLKASRTAMHTRLRTVDEVRDAKQQTLLYHSMRMEYAFWFGVRGEQALVTEPERTTDGLHEVITRDAAANVFTATNGIMDMEDIEEQLLEAFRWGSQEKMGFCGNRALLAIQRIARNNASLEITPSVKEFGMDVRRLFTPYGTLVLKTHPLFNQIQSVDATPTTGTYSLDSWIFVVDMGNLTYRPLRSSDTQYLPDRQSNGVDGLTSEYLTECGLEISHAKTHYLIKGLVQGAADS